MKLNLGCSDRRIEGYINIDCRYQPGVDKIDNVGLLRLYEDNSVDVIYACHVLEHFGRHEYKAVLQRWYTILKPGGILRLAVPNMYKVCKMVADDPLKMFGVLGLLYGGQDYDENFHKMGWTAVTLYTDLRSAGFDIGAIKEYDWRETEHADVDDCSQSYLPHMDKENGQLMSLNMEATK